MKMLQYLRDFCTDAERVEALLGQLLNPRMSPRSFDDRDHDLLLENETDGEDSEERQLESDRQKLRQPAPVMVVPKKASVGPSRHQQHQQQEEPSASPPATHHPRPDLGVLPLAPPAAAAESTPADDDSSGEGSSSYNALLYYCVLHRGRGSTTGGGGGDGTSHQPLPPAVDVSARWRSLNFLPAPGLST
ncbi:uncharacterized protein ACA1_070860 [Acanthamoeba castellanii str. Neff]|uniref:Uncharacterized protein n=1 Tax=Acanthamoeba castellanii (strain ATCC 30010 / Neff) TaxID=1257118 RepID=L8HE48_ACACF|nr:uncharacterized protein ACA1_070860 [Acanthamoeba castellanii str. Neff]ELR23465.1 hypothetical protein ACA1_070860 [Acanthamoeba castellanii str. Neff]